MTRPAARGPLRLLGEVLARKPGPPLVLGDAVSVEEIRKSPELQLELIQAFQENRPGAAEILTLVHMPLIKARAGRYVRSCERDYEDLVQEGILGMLEACARWDFDHGTKHPLGYIYPYVRQAIGRFASQKAQVVRYPVQHARIKGSEAGRNFAPQCWFFSDLDEKGYQPKGPCTLPADREDTRDSFEDGIFDGAQSAEEALCDHGFEDIVPVIAENLSRGLASQKKNILARRFREDEPETLLEIGDSYGLSRERIRQIETDALGRCRERARMFGCDPWSRDGMFEEWVMALSMRLKILSGDNAERVLAALGYGWTATGTTPAAVVVSPETRRELSAMIRRARERTAHLWRGLGAAL
jgi:RNA polymerase sigma factor (sigma-70 family)